VTNEEIIAETLAMRYCIEGKRGEDIATKDAAAILAALAAAERHITWVDEDIVVPEGLHLLADSETVVDGQRGRLEPQFVGTQFKHLYKFVPSPDAGEDAE
jgi:hypothetical protein